MPKLYDSPGVFVRKGETGAINNGAESPRVTWPVSKSEGLIPNTS